MERLKQERDWSCEWCGKRQPEYMPLCGRTGGFCIAGGCIYEPMSEPCEDIKDGEICGNCGRIIL